jgi:uncharacterized membrane protein (UPF0127 family)
VTTVLLVSALVVVGFVAHDELSGLGGPDRTTVTVLDEDGRTLGAVEVRVADTYRERYTGLSDAESLGPDEGMLFVHDEEGEYAYVMRRMDFPLDIVFIDADGRITTIHHAPVPEEIENGNGRFPGHGKYVLEVPRGYTNATGVDVGDRVTIPAGVDQ